jgi:hypothetical protein
VTDADPRWNAVTPLYIIGEQTHHRSFLATVLGKAIVGTIIACAFAALSFWAGVKTAKHSGRIALSDHSQDAEEQ